jgi:hypothetical protein
MRGKNKLWGEFKVFVNLPLGDLIFDELWSHSSVSTSDSPISVPSSSINTEENTQPGEGPVVCEFGFGATTRIYRKVLIKGINEE